MTRINLIAPSLLTNKQLLAEYRELPRIINRVAAGKTYKTIPAQFTMGAGHESFFGNKLWFLHKRHIAIRKELHRRREINKDRFKGPYVICTKAAWNQAVATQPYECKDWTPSKRDILASMERLVERQFDYKTNDRWGERVITTSTVWEAWAQNVAFALGITNEVRDMVNQYEVTA